MQDLESWCLKLLNMNVKASLSTCWFAFQISTYLRFTQDPSVWRKLLLLVHSLTLTTSPPQTSLPLTICERALSHETERESTSAAYTEAVKDLRLAEIKIVQKLAMKYSDLFMVRLSLRMTFQLMA